MVFIRDILSFADMASNSTKPSRGRPRRKEEIRHITFKASTYEIWKDRKNQMGLSNLNNSELGELLLHRIASDVEPQQQQQGSPRSPRRKCKRTACRCLSNALGWALISAATFLYC